MNTEILGVVVTFLVAVVLAIPTGRYIARVFDGRKTLLDSIFNPIESAIYRFSGIDPSEDMNWKQHLSAMLTINAIWFLFSIAILMNQQWLPLNPDNNPSMSADLAFNTAISFVVNCNLQHYSGESGLSYLGQMWLMFLQFMSAATGIAALVVVFRSFREKSTAKLGNFYQVLLQSATRILLPISMVLAVLLLMDGMPMTFDGRSVMYSLEGVKVDVATGPVAAFVPIKHVGTNGGGFFGTNSAHPFENPTYFSNMMEMLGQLLLPMALIFAMGFFIKREKLALMIFGVMTLGFLMLVIPNVHMEMQGNQALSSMGIDNGLGAMEGKETRIGAAASGFWSIVTTVISTGSVNSMHDSSMPLSGMNEMLAMMINSFYGGNGVGVLNFFIFIILTVFISGLMVGRTPEFLGKKIEAREMKIAMVIALIHPLLILSGAALATAFPAYGLSAVNNPGFHGFSEILYEYTSASANNGSGFEGLADNTVWWNISTGVVMILGRFLPIIGPVAIAGLLAAKKQIPEGAGTLQTDTMTFGMMVFIVILLIAALAFFPALTLGPIAEYFTMK